MGRFYTYHEDTRHLYWVVEQRHAPPSIEDDKLVAQFDDRYPESRESAERFCAVLHAATPPAAAPAATGEGS